MVPIDISLANISQLAIDGISTASDAIPAEPSSTPMLTSFFLAMDPSSAIIVHTAAARAGIRSKT
jgi:hypothetical protein